jgi:hypothetical protein
MVRRAIGRGSYSGCGLESLGRRAVDSERASSGWWGWGWL